VQAIQLVWATLTKLLSDNVIKSVVGSVHGLISSEIIMKIAVACAQLPLCSFATPKTRFGMQRRLHYLGHLTPLHLNAVHSSYLLTVHQPTLSGDEALILAHLCTCRQDRGFVADARPLAAG
jgi:hypothetical protein